MNIPNFFASALAILALSSPPALAGGTPWILSLDQPEYALHESINFQVSGTPGEFGFILFDPIGGPSEPLPGLILDIAFSPQFMIMPLLLPASGSVNLPCGLTCDLLAILTSMPPLHVQGVSIDLATATPSASNSVVLQINDNYGNCGACSDCLGGVVFMTMRYVGQTAGFVEAVEFDKSGAVKNTYFSGSLQPFDVISINGTGKSNKLGKILSILVDGAVSTEINTSCSKPIGPGLSFGDFFVIAADSKDNGPICPQTASAGDGCADGKPIELEFRYTGEDCSASSHGQDSTKATCTGDPAFAATVHARAFGSHGDVYFDADVNLGDSFWVKTSAAGVTKLDNSMNVELTDAAGNLLQAVTFHASCSQPIGIGDVYGALALIGYVATP